MKFRKKPGITDAVKFSELESAPQEFKDAVCTSGYRSCDYDQDGHIHTLEGVMKISSGDWIIKGVKGEFYPCKPDIFAETYEVAPNPSPAPEVMGTPEQDHELGDPLWPIYEKYAATRPKKLLTYSGWLKQVALKLEAPQPDPWVDVKVGLPEPNKFVLMAVSKTEFHFCSPAPIQIGHIFSDGLWSAHGVTHWRELPAPPETRATEGK